MFRYFKYLTLVPKFMGIAANLEPYFDHKEFGKRRDLVDAIVDIQNAVNKRPSKFGPRKVNASFEAFEVIHRLKQTAELWQERMIDSDDAVVALLTDLGQLISAAKHIDPSLGKLKALSYADALPNLARVYPLAEQFFKDRNFDVRAPLVDAVGALVAVFVKDYIVQANDISQKLDVALILWQLAHDFDKALEDYKRGAKTGQVGVVLRAIREQVLILRPDWASDITLDAVESLRRLIQKD